MEEIITSNEAITPLFASSLPSIYTFTHPNGTKRSIHTCTREKSPHITNDNELSSSKTDNQLFVDDIWPASYFLSDYLVSNIDLCKDKNVLELGAGAALPSCVADALGAKNVVMTDFPAHGVIANIHKMIVMNHLSSSTALGHVWGESVDELISFVGDGKYDTILLADVLWKDTYAQHHNLLKSIRSCISSSHDTIALIAFSHRPTESHTIEMDMEFFHKASSDFGLNWKFITSSKEYGNDIYEANPIEIFLYSLQVRT